MESPQKTDRAGILPVGSTHRTWDAWRQTLVSTAAGWDSDGLDAQTVARSVCGQLTRTLWALDTAGNRRWLPPAPGCTTVSYVGLQRKIIEAADFLSQHSLIEASYSIGLLYTDLLPAAVRSARGVYYTPPVLAERLLDLAAAEGTDWSTATVLDPACGGGAFLVPAAVRMLGHHRLRQLDAGDQLSHLERHLAGVELDDFAAWMTRAFLQLLVYPQSQVAGRALDVPVLTADALELVLRDERRFDLVVGNPPFGRVSLGPEQREAFSRSLFGHANLYGVFLDAGLRWRKDSGLVAFLTPTSFLGGQYYSRLRSLLLAEAPPLVIDVVSDRTGVFPSVQQETCLTVFGPNPSRTTTVHLAAPKDDGLQVERAGAFRLDARGLPGAPWFLPRTRLQASLAETTVGMRTRLELLGYRASTGPLVWNRHKRQLRARSGANSYPLVWAEAVRPSAFCFDYRARLDRSFIEVEDGQDHLLTSRPCVLVQRTTAKEQRRRLVACAVPQDFLWQWGAIVVENHVNVLSSRAPAKVSPAALAAVLNTLAVDEVFRCLSGSVAVSSTELHALPLPPLAVFEEVEGLLTEPLSVEAEQAIEILVAEAYGVPWTSLVA